MSQLPVFQPGEILEAAQLNEIVEAIDDLRASPDFYAATGSGSVATGSPSNLPAFTGALESRGISSASGGYWLQRPGRYAIAGSVILLDVSNPGTFHYIDVTPTFQSATAGRFAMTGFNVGFTAKAVTFYTELVAPGGTVSESGFHLVKYGSGTATVFAQSRILIRRIGPELST